MLFDFCLSLEQLLCCFIYRESYSAGNLGNDPSGHSICRSSQNCLCVFASKYKMLLCLLPSFFLQGQIRGVWRERRKEEDPARYWGSTWHAGWKLQCSPTLFYFLAERKSDLNISTLILIKQDLHLVEEKVNCANHLHTQHIRGSIFVVFSLEKWLKISFVLIFQSYAFFFFNWFSNKGKFTGCNLC